MNGTYEWNLEYYDARKGVQYDKSMRTADRDCLWKKGITMMWKWLDDDIEVVYSSLYFMW